jgi:hypothetical protein
MTDKMLLHHGTSDTMATSIASGSIDVAVGAGELGQGFYTGALFYEAKRWAIHKHSIEIDEPDFFSLDVLSLSAQQATAQRNNIRLAGTTQTHVFLHDVVWSSIIGDGTVRGDQHKWESSKSGRFLNGSKAKRSVKK